MTPLNPTISEETAPRAPLVSSAIASTVVFVVLTLAAGCSQDAYAQARSRPSEPAVHATVVPVVEKSMPDFTSLTGTLSAYQQSDVAANAMGRVVATFVERGQKVSKGDVLAALDARTASLGATAAKAQSRVASSQADLARLECGRAEDLFSADAITRSDYDRITTQCRSSQYQSESAEAARRIATQTVSDSLIRAPFDGIIGQRYVSVGEFVVSATKIASLYSVKPLRLELTVPESVVGSVHDRLGVEFRVAAFPDRVFQGTIKYISPNVRPVTRDLVVEAIVPNPDGVLLPGMFAAARISIGESLRAVVPLAAVRGGGNDHRAFVVEDGSAQERVLQLGEKRDGLVVVLQGVSPGESVIVGPGDAVRDGVRIQ